MRMHAPTKNPEELNHLSFYILSDSSRVPLPEIILLKHMSCRKQVGVFFPPQARVRLHKLKCCPYFYMPCSAGWWCSNIKSKIKLSVWPNPSLLSPSNVARGRGILKKQAHKIIEKKGGKKIINVDETSRHSIWYALNHGSHLKNLQKITKRQKFILKLGQ
jgi:hypothetical protein